MQGQDPPVQGSALFDPTQNVLNLAQSIEKLVAAAMQRQDDLRERDAAHAREMRETARMYEARLDSKDTQIRKSEADRIDAIQARSDLTVQRAAEVQEAQQRALAAQVTATADTFRGSIATELAPIKLQLAEVQRAQYETQGQKQQVVESRDSGADKRDAERVLAAEAQARTAKLYGGIAAAIAILSFLITLYLLTRPGK